MASAVEQFFKWKDERDPSVHKDGATMWTGQFQIFGLQAWKVTRDSVEEWKLAEEGKFFSEEVYIVLKCDPKSRSTTSYDIHCWVGKSAPNRQYARGLYYAIALDNAMESRLQCRPLVHREVQDYESKRFMDYFTDFTVLTGTSQGSVKNNLHTEYNNRLLRITGPTGTRRNICVRETSLKKGALLDSNDVYIIDTSTKIYTWIGSGLSRNESKVLRAKEYSRKLQAERGPSDIKVVTVDSFASIPKELTLERNKKKFIADFIDENEVTKNHVLYDVFPYQTRKKSIVRGVQFASVLWQKKKTMYIYTSSPARPFRKVAEGADLRDWKMNSDEVTVVDIRFGGKDGEDHLFLRIGEDWRGENGLIIGHHYLRWLPKEVEQDEHWAKIPITVVKEGQQSKQLSDALTPDNYPLKWRS